jgi:membrane-associated phospholipid phosphatase
MGWNLLGAVSYNYGINFIGAGLGTWTFVETGVDWKWRNIAYDNTWLSDFVGRPALYVGFIVPGVTPIVTYTIGRFTNNEKLQIAGLALAQSLVLTLAIQTPLKMITGRTLPGIINDEFGHHTRNQRTDDFSNEFNWFNKNFVDGWPSGHTANAFAAAATLSEIYKDNLWLKIGVYSYAALTGFGVATDVHWASEVLAGALIGYAVGKTVGKSFSKLLENNVSDNHVSLYFTQNSIGVVMHFY